MKNLSSYIEFGGGASDIEYTFTIIPTPSDAKVLINDIEQNSIKVKAGRNVSWSVSKDGYITQRGIEAVNYDTTKEIALDETIVVDEATQAYLDATGISEVAMIRKLDAMVTSLKSEGLWDKIDALYPCVGSTFEQMSYNLKDVNTYKLSASNTPTVTENIGFYSTKAVTSTYNSNRLGTDFHTLGVSGTVVEDAGSGIVSPGASSGNGSASGVLAYYTKSSVQMRTPSANWSISNITVPEHCLFIGSLSSGIVLNGASINASKTGTLNITKYPFSFIHNGFRSSDSSTFSNPFQVRLSGFGAALTIEEMETYSSILNEFKNFY